MIVIDDVHKRYQTDHGPSKWILQGVSLTIPPNTNVGLVGKNGAGKSTLLRIIGGVDQPTRGKVERLCRVSWPMGFGGGLQRSLTGRQNAKFVCRIQGHENDIARRLAFIQEFAEIGDAFDEPVKTYSSGMAARLKFAISLAFDFDVYISDELTAVGDAAFKKKAKDAFRELVGRAGLIMVSHGESTLKEFCTAGIWLHEGKAHWFDDIEDALQAYRESQADDGTTNPTIDDTQDTVVPQQDEEIRKLSRRMNGVQMALNVLQKGMKGDPVTLDEEMAARVSHRAKRIGMHLLSERQLIKRGFQIKDGAIPLLRKYTAHSMGHVLDLYDINSQCVKVESIDNDATISQ